MVQEYSLLPDSMNSAKIELDHKVLDVEILLISVVQGVALAALATSSFPLIDGMKFEFFLYVAAGLILILTFWAQAIIHTLSFISWPIDLAHNFLYIIIAFLEVLVFGQLSNPLKWFIYLTIFFIVVGILYMVDYLFIKRNKNEFNETSRRKSLYSHILSRQSFELKKLLPIGILYAVGSALLITFYPKLFIDQHFHLLLIAGYVIFAIVILADSVKNFNHRSRLISEAEGI